MYNGDEVFGLQTRIKFACGFHPAVVQFLHLHVHLLLLSVFITELVGSSVGTETDYGLDGPGSNPGGDEIFRPSRPTLGPTQSPVQWVTGLSRG